MSIKQQDLKRTRPIALQKKTSSTGVSAVVDSNGFGRVLIDFEQGTGFGRTITCAFKACSASATLFASATVVPGVTSGTLTASATSLAWMLSTAKLGKRFIRVKMTASNSTIMGCIADFSQSRLVVPATTGFTTVNVISS